MTSPFTAVADDHLVRFLAENPLCWIVPHADPAAAILMPVLLECDAAGKPHSLLGHLPQTSPSTRVLSNRPEASFLFLGPNSYIPPATAEKRDWAPTWNFVSARLTGIVALDPELTQFSVEAMVAHMEGKGGWRPTELGPRYGELLKRIVGYRATIVETAPRFKLGQDESEQVAGAIDTALSGTPLGEWMQRLMAE